MNGPPAKLAFALMAALFASPLLASWESGVSAFHAGRYDEATAAFRSIVAASPEAPEGHYMLGLSLLRQKNLTAALDSLDRAVELAQNDVRYRLALAQAQLKADEPAGAVATLGGQDPASVPAEMRATFSQLLARAATPSPDPNAAYAALERGLESDPASRALWLALSQVARRLDRLADSFSALVAAFDLDPSDPDAARSAVATAFDLARAESDSEKKIGWYRDGSRVAQKLASSAPSAEHQLLAGEALMGARDYEGAIGWFEKAAASGDAGALPHYYLGRCHLALSHNGDALKHLQTALAHSPDARMTSGIHEARGLALRGLEDFAAAAGAYRLAGDAATAAEMDRYAQNREEVAKAKAVCILKRTRLEQLLAASKDIEHTREYELLSQDLAAHNAVCRSYFLESG